jgi:hypothetical protein
MPRGARVSGAGQRLEHRAIVARHADGRNGGGGAAERATEERGGVVVETAADWAASVWRESGAARAEAAIPSSSA